MTVISTLHEYDYDPLGVCFNSPAEPALGAPPKNWWNLLGGHLVSTKKIRHLDEEMGKQMGKVADDLAPFQNKNLSPGEQAALTQLMSNKAGI